MSDCNKILENCNSLSLDQMDYYLMGNDVTKDVKCREILKEYKRCKEKEKMKQNNTYHDLPYLDLVNKILKNNHMEYNNRTKKNCMFYLGDMMKFDLSDGSFPLLTTKKMAYKSMIGELIGFLRGVDNAKDFRDLKCKFWDANANESVDWLNNPNRKGEDDLGRIYGVQAREWKNPSGETVDQLNDVVEKLKQGIDDRRLIVTHWNPGELKQMALPPCHMTYIFGLRDGYLDLCMLQRSCDVPLGIPMNIASYALLLILIAKITGHKVGIFTHFMWNIHIYEDQLEEIKKQITREPYPSPKIKINCELSSLDDITNKLTVDDIEIVDYQCHDAIKFNFAE